MCVCFVSVEYNTVRDEPIIIGYKAAIKMSCLVLRMLAILYAAAQLVKISVCVCVFVRVWRIGVSSSCALVMVKNML